MGMAALTDTATDTGTDTMARGPLTPAPMLGVTDMAAPTATVTDTDTDTMARGPLMPSLLLLLRPSLRLRPMPTTDTALVSMATTLTATDSPMLATDTDTIMARGPLTPMPGDTDTAAPTDTDTATGTDMARGPLTPMPGDTDTAAHTDTDTATGTDTLMASKLPHNLVACHRTPMSSKYLSHSC